MIVITGIDEVVGNAKRKLSEGLRAAGVLSVVSGRVDEEYDVCGDCRRYKPWFDSSHWTGIATNKRARVDMNTPLLRGSKYHRLKDA